jgi:hypothetical protein
MFRLVSAFVLSALVTFFLVDRSANGDDSSVVALATNRTIPAFDAPRSLALDDIAGVYETADGATFVVARDGESFTISLPETVALPIRAAGPGFALDASLMRIAFETDGDCACVRLKLAGAVEDTVVATRVNLPQGVVTIHDI